MSRPPEFDLEFSSESCPCGCRGDAALHEAFESGLSGEAWRQRRPSRPAPGGPGSGPRPPARRPGPRHRPGPFRPGIVPLYEPYAAGPGPEAGTERTRWVQDCLNRIFSLQLPVDGILDAAARSALRRLQQQERLPATGIVSPTTERALRRRCGKAGEPNEQEWESEVSRSSPDYIRWVQSSLNKMLGLRLAVDGIIGTMTRSAIRSFQQRQYGLQVDGVVGPMTERVLIHAEVPPSGTGTPAPTPTAPLPVPPTPYVEPDPTRFNYCFIMGTTGPYYDNAKAFAEAYYSNHREIVFPYEIVYPDSFCDLLEHIEEKVDIARDAFEERQKLGHVVIITHADGKGGLYFPLQSGDEKNYVTAEDVEKFLSKDWLLQGAGGCRSAFHAVGRRSDAETRVTIKGCNLGKSQAALNAMRNVFGGQATVTAPKKPIIMKTEGWGQDIPGRRTEAEVIDWMIQNGYLPPKAAGLSEQAKTSFVRSLYSDNVAIKGIPADYLVLEDGKKCLPSQPGYQKNLAVSKP